MDSNKNSANLTNIFFLAIFFLLLLSLAGYALYNSNFATSGTDADNSPGEYTYTSDLSNFQSIGDTVGVTTFGSTTSSDSYTTAGLKGIQSVKFNAQNLPLGSGVRACVSRAVQESGVVSDVFCVGRNVETSSNYVFEANLPFAVLVEPETDYFCRMDVFDFDHSKAKEAYTSAQADCEFTVDALSSEKRTALAVSGHLLNNVSQGSDLLPGMNYSLKSEYTLLGINAAVVADSSLKQQTIASVCAGSGEKVCMDDYIFSEGIDGQLEPILYLQDGLSLDSDLSFDCETAQGVSGVCSLIGYIDVTSEFLDDYALGVIDRSEFYSLNSTDVGSYCENSQYLYENTLAFSKYNTSDRGAERCKAVLSSTSF